jgi:predicted metal-binding membrane protein
VGNASLLERALRRDRAIVVAGLLAVVVLAWLELLREVAAMAGTTATMPGMAMEGMTMGDMAMPGMAIPVAAVWSTSHALAIGAMWAVMMAAMMLPAASPMILFYTRIAGQRGATRSASVATAVFVLGYLAVWAFFSIGAAALQLAFERYALISPAMRTTSTVLAGLVLVAAGVYQFTPAKRACLRHCRSPLEFVMLHWQPGARGAFAMGVRHGAYCVGCCWLLMLLLFVGGVMNVAWIAGIALYVLVEKTVPAGHWVSRAAGVVLVLAGAATLLALA